MSSRGEPGDAAQPAGALTYRDLEVTFFGGRSTPSGLEYRVVAETFRGEMPRSRAPVVVADLADPAWTTLLDALAAGTIDADGLHDLGERLGDLALPVGPVRSAFRELRAAAAAVGDGVRLRLLIEPDTPVTSVPWEYMAMRTGAARRDSDFLVFDTEVSISIVRSDAAARPVLEGLPERPLTRVVAVLAEPSGVPPLRLDLDRAAVEATTNAVNDAAGDTVAEVAWVAEPGSWHRLLEALESSADMVHFAGHGRLAGATGELVFEDPDTGRPEEVDASRVAGVLSAAGVRLAILGACESGSRSEGEPWAALAPAIAGEGVPAVVGHQYRIRDKAASAFGAVLYPMLLRGYPVDQAVAAARRHIKDRFGGLAYRDWGVPVLYHRSDDGVLFPRPRGTSTVFAEAVQRALLAGAADESGVDVLRSPFVGLRSFTRDEAGRFHGREVAGAALLRRISDHQVTVVHGPAGSGKTSLLLAGLAPALNAAGTRLVRVAGYGADPVAATAAALALERPDSVAPGTSLGAAAELVVAGGQDVLIALDQFERLVDGDRFVDLLAQLGEAAARLPRLRLLYVLRSEAADALLAQLAVPSLVVDRFDRDTAAHVAFRTINDHGVVQVSRGTAEAIAADIDRLSSSSGVDPTVLQMVFGRLWVQAWDRRAERGNTLVDADLYPDGIAQVAAGYLEELIVERVGEAAGDLLGSDALLEDRWVTAEALHLGRSDQAEAALERLVDAGVLASRRREVAEYRVVNPSVARVAAGIAGDPKRRLREARATLDAIVDAWEFRRAIASVGELRFLAAISDAVRPSFTETLLLVRAAAGRNEDAAVWIDHLESRFQAEVDQLAAGALPAADGAWRLFGIADPTTAPGDVGPLAARAAAAAGEIDGTTAAMTLAAATNGRRRLRAALEAAPSGRRRRRDAATWAAVTSAADAPVGAAATAPVRVMARSIRLWDDIRRDRLHWTAILGTMALTLAFSLGLARMAISFLLPGELWRQILVNWALFGAVLGAGLAVGVLFAAAALRLGQTGQVAAGAAGFGLAHWFLFWTFGGAGIGVVTPLAFAAGVPLAWLMATAPRSRTLAAGAGAVLITAVQAVLTAIGCDQALLVGRSARFLRSELPRLFPSLDGNTECWFWWASVADAAVVGAALGAAVVVAVGWAARVETRYRAIESRIGDISGQGGTS